MKKMLKLNLILLCTVFLFSGCVTTQSLKNSFTSATFSSMDKLYSQVPENQRQTVKDAEKHLDLAKEKIKLAGLQKDMAVKQEKLSGYKYKLAELSQEEAIIGVQIAKWEAIDAQGLGQKEKNIKSLYDLRMELSKKETDRLQLQKDIATRKLHIKKLNKEIQDQESKVESMESTSSKFKDWLDKIKNMKIPW